MRPVRVLHVLRSISRNGVETRLFNRIRCPDHRRLAVDMLTETAQEADHDSARGQVRFFDREARALGVAIAGRRRIPLIDQCGSAVPQYR